MVKPEKRLKIVFVALHSLFVILWLTVSTVIYGLFVILLSFFCPLFANKVVRMWAKHLLFFSGIKLNVEGIKKLDSSVNYVFVANHLSVFDIPAFYSALPFRIGFIAKKELFDIPLFGRIMLASNTLPVDRKSARQARISIDKAVGNIKNKKISVVIFPEGTRSLTGSLGEFKQASFTIPLESGISVVPVALSGSEKILRKKSLLLYHGTITFRIGVPIAIKEGVSKVDLCSDVRSAIIKLNKV